MVLVTRVRRGKGLRAGVLNVALKEPLPFVNTAFTGSTACGSLLR